MPIIHATLKRKEDTQHGMFGELYIVDKRICYILEPPWKDNQENMSCIPTGSYIVAPHWSPRFGNVFKVHGVPKRTEILIHAGNRVKETHGCIMPGLERTSCTVKYSIKALDKLKNLIGESGCVLTITKS